MSAFTGVIKKITFTRQAFRESPLGPPGPYKEDGGSGSSHRKKSTEMEYLPKARRIAFLFIKTRKLFSTILMGWARCWAEKIMRL